MTVGTTLDDISTGPRSAALNRSAVRWYVGCALGLGLLGGAAAYATAPLLPASFTTTSQVVFGNPTPISVLGTSSVGTTALTNSEAASDMFRSQEVSAEASELLDGRLSAHQVADQTAITSSTNSPIVVVTASATSPRLAKDLADALPQAYQNVESRSYAQRAQQTARLLNQVLDDQQKRLADVQSQLAQKVQAANSAAGAILGRPNDQASYVQATLDTDVAYQQLRNEAGALTTKVSETQDAIQQTTVDSSALQSGVDRVLPAGLPSSARPAQKRNVAIGIGLGALLGALIGWRIAERRRTVEPALAAAALGAPLLGSIGPDRRLRRLPGFVDVAADDALSNELKVLAASLVLSARRRGCNSIVVTSAHRREGKSVLARNLGVAAEYTGQPVVLVDAGFGRPTTTELLDLENQAGLAEVVEGEPPTRLIQHLGYDDGGRVPVLPVGLNGFATEPGRKLNEARRQHWAAALAALRPMLPLVDAPAVSDHPLALQLATGGGLVVIASPRTTLTDLDVIRNRADVADVPILGIILNRSSAGGRRGRRGRGAGGARVPNFVIEPADDRQTTI